MHSGRMLASDVIRSECLCDSGRGCVPRQCQGRMLPATVTVAGCLRAILRQWQDAVARCVAVLTPHRRLPRLRAPALTASRRRQHPRPRPSLAFMTSTVAEDASCDSRCQCDASVARSPSVTTAITVDGVGALQEVQKVVGASREDAILKGDEDEAVSPLRRPNPNHMATYAS